jgi:hypothetical protein
MRRLTPWGNSRDAMDDLQIIQNKIYELRGQRVMLDRDLAAMYGVETKVLNQAVKRNIKRFPDDFVFQLTQQELQNWKSQFVTSNSIKMGVRKRPYAFTEQGVAMLAGVLNSDAAVRANIVIMRAFVQMRSYLAMTPETLAARLESIDRRLLELEQSRIAGELGSVREPALPERLSAEVRIVDYSARAVVVFTDNRLDRRLLKWLGARYNGWLTWNGERVAGWVYPKSCMDKLSKYLSTSSGALQRDKSAK